MSRRTDHRVGNAVIVLALALLGMSLYVFATRGSGIGLGGSIEDVAWTEVLSILTVYGIYAVVGGLVLRHSASNPIGIFVAIMGLVPLIGNLAEVAAIDGGPGGLFGDLVAWVIAWYFYVFFGAFVPLFHVFPTGRPMPGLWRWWYRLALVGAGVLVFVGLFGSIDEGVVNPFEIGLVTAVAPVLEFVVLSALAIGLLTGVASLGFRFHRARARERQQLKWFFFSVVVAVGLFVGMVVLGDALGLIPSGLAETLASLAFPLPAVGILVAVVRGGLFDIDRIVSRTATYVLVASVLIAVYTVPVVVLPGALGLSGDLTVAGATLAAAAVFNPLRRWIQRRVDRRFNRARYDGERVLATVGARMQTMANSASLRTELGTAVAETLHPNSVSVWVAGEVS